MQKRQSGSVSLIFVLLFAAIGLSAIGMYNSGQITTNKIKLRNTADAAAYSAVNTVARELNYMAYTNRAMIANQVAIGQMIGLVSWAAYVHTTAETLQTIANALSWIPYIGPFLKQLADAIETGAEILETAVEWFTDIFIPIINVALQALSGSQAIMHFAMVETLYNTTQRVIEENDPDIDTSALASAYSMGKYVSDINTDFMSRTNVPKVNASSDDEKRDLKRYNEFALATANPAAANNSSIADGRDPFSKERSNQWFSINLFVVKFKLNKYGGTELTRTVGEGSSSDNYVWEWNAMDTLGLHRWNRKWSGGWRYKKDTPIGWGAAHQLNQDNTGSSFDYAPPDSGNWWDDGCNNSAHNQKWGNGAWKNCRTADKADSEFGDNNRPENTAGFVGVLESATDSFLGILDVPYNSGLQRFYSLKEDGKVTRGPEMLLYVSKQNGKVKSFNKIVANEDSLKTFDIEEVEGDNNHMSNSDIAAEISKAVPYFMRPHGITKFNRRDNKYEYGNLYNPYWQAKLVEASLEEQKLAMGISGI